MQTGLVSNTSFKSNNTRVGDPFEQFKRPQNTAYQATQADSVEINGKKKTLSDKFHEAKEGAISAVNSINTAAITAGGVVGGFAKGAGATLATGVIAKNIIENSKKSLSEGVAKTVGGIITDSIKGIGYTLKGCKGIWNTTVGKVITSPLNAASKFFGSYLKNNKGAAAIAIVAGVATLATNVLCAKIEANKKAANLREAAGLDQA